MYLLCWVFFVSAVCASNVYFSEHFDDESPLETWKQSAHHPDETRGAWSLSPSKAWKNISNLGLKTENDSRFYAISKKLDEPFSNEGKTLVVQFAVKYEQQMTCGGAYLKLLNSAIDPMRFHGESPYLFMFGPDICGPSTRKVHAIFNYKGKNHLIKKDVRCKDDLLSHLYTFILTPDNKYKILIDNEKVEEGSLEDDWDMLPPKRIDDPNAKKPEDWVDIEQIDDPDDKKPDDWDQPDKIPDTSATQPEDWDTELDGEWAPPTIPNPDYKGEWKPRKIDNPLYKGPWIPPQIDNPKFQPDDKLYVMEDIAQIGLDLWQVNAKTIFDDFLLTDDPEFARAEGERLWRPRFNAESEYEKHKESEDLKDAEDKSDDSEDEDKSESAEEFEKPDTLEAGKTDELVSEHPEGTDKVESDTHEEL